MSNGDSLYFGPCLRPESDDDPYKPTRADSGDWLTDYFAKMMPAAEQWFEEQDAEPDDDSAEPLIIKAASYIEVSDELLMDYGVIPDTRPPLPPPSWRTRLRWKRGMWRNLAARRAYKVIAGYWPDNGEDDW